MSLDGSASEAALAAPRLGVGARAWALVRAMRPKQWIKNLFVFAALVFAGKMFEPVAVVRSLYAFAAFCAVASSVYLVNDVVDRKQDALHPKKRLRPIASGQVGVGLALGWAGVLAVIGLAGSFWLGPKTLEMVLLYVVFTASYNLGLKHQFLLDVMLISAGFVLRATAGAAAIHVEISAWLLACTFLLALFLALGKRRAELELLGEGAEEHRKTLGHYSVRMLDSWLSALSGAAIVCYALYTQAPRTVAHFHTSALIFTLPFVIYGLFRYQHLLVHAGMGGDPGSVLLRDRGVIIAVLGWAVTAAWVIYAR